LQHQCSRRRPLAIRSIDDTRHRDHAPEPDRWILPQARPDEEISLQHRVEHRTTDESPQRLGPVAGRTLCDLLEHETEPGAAAPLRASFQRDPDQPIESLLLPIETRLDPLELLPDSLAKRYELVPEMLDHCSECRDRPGVIA